MKPFTHRAAGVQPRVLIVKLSSLGDLFHVLPLVHAIKSSTGAVIDWVTQKEYCPVVTCFTEVARVISFPRHGFPRTWPSFLRALRLDAYDLVLDCQGLLKSAVVARMARGERRIGPSFNRECSRWLYDAIAGPRDKQRHAVEENLDMARALGVAVQEIVFPVRFPPLETGIAHPRIGMVPVSRWETKNWPLEHFIELADAVAREMRASVCVFGGAQVGERTACERVARAADGRGHNLAGRTSLTELGSWIAAMDLVVTNDSGPMHIAAALGVPVLALFGPTDPIRTGPYGARHRVIVAPMACRPCHGKVCMREDMACMRSISPAVVVQAIREMIQQ